MRKYAIYLVILFLSLSCKFKKENRFLKNSKNDLFKQTIVKSQFFKINPEKDTLIIGERGTRIVIPKNTFLNSKGKEIKQNIQFELSEALTLDEMILSNLTTTSNGKLLETDGMIFINATYKGENLTIKNKSPLYIEIPTKNKKPNMMVYRGIRDAMGNMNWIKPKKLKQYLIPVDIELLDFLPEGFEKEAISYLRYKKKKINKKTIDSLYYNLPPSKCHLTKYTTRHGGLDFRRENLGVKPVSIQTIKDKKFNNTLIATREFQERMYYIHKSCDYTNLDLYVNNLNKDMWEIDSLVANNMPDNDAIIQTRTVEYTVQEGNYDYKMEERVLDTVGYKPNTLQEKFISFKNQKLTNVEHKSTYINELQAYYTTQLKENIKKTDSIRQIAIEKENNTKEKQAYKKILKEREKITMQSYGFTQTETGWINIDRGTIPKKWNYQPVEVLVESDIQFEQIHTYLVFSKTKSIVKLKSFAEKQFQLNELGENIPITKNSKVKVIVVALKGEQYYYGKQEFTSRSDDRKKKIWIKVLESNIKTIKEKLQNLETKYESNSVAKDLELSIILKKEEKHKRDLLKVAYPCCSELN